MPFLKARYFSKGAGVGTCCETSRTADSFRIPVGSPWASRRMAPPGGSSVVRVIPALARASALTQAVWPS